MACPRGEDYVAHMPVPRRAGALVALALIAALAGCSGGSKAGGGKQTHKTPLRLEVSVGTVTTVQAWAAEAAKLSGGRLAIQVSASQLAHSRATDPERRVIEQVRSGALPIAAVGARAFDLLGVRSFQPLLAPFLVDSYDLQQLILGGPLPRAMLAGTRRLGVVGVAVLPGPPRHVLGVQRPLRAPADFRGAVVGMQEGGVTTATLRAFGARARAEGLEQPLSGIDGYELQLGSVAGNGYYKQARYMTSNLTLWPRLLVVIVNARVYRKLTAPERAALATAGGRAIGTEIATAQRDDTEALRILCSSTAARHFSFVTASPVEIAELRQAVAPVYAQIERDPAARAVLARIRALKARATPDKAPACAKGASTAGAASRARTALDGAWAMKTRIPDGERAGHSYAELGPENLGDWRFVLDRGRFAFTQRFRNACTWGFGTYSVRSGAMRWLMAGGGGMAPSGAVNKPGEDFTFKWSRFHDTLKLGPFRGAISPDNFFLRPWHLISKQPSPRYFERRCPPPAEWDAS